LTVPAIWDDEAKYFMRVAAHAAGLIDSPSATNLLMALEPESAVLAAIADCAPAERKKFEPGTRIMVVDCGGGTVDITCDEIVGMAPLALKEVHEATGGPWGATFVDRRFMGFMRELLGERWKYVTHAAQLELLSTFEEEKKSVGDGEHDGDTINIRVMDIIDLLNGACAPSRPCPLVVRVRAAPARSSCSRAPSGEV